MQLTYCLLLTLILVGFESYPLHDHKSCWSTTSTTLNGCSLNDRDDVAKHQSVCDVCFIMMPIIRNLANKNKTTHIVDIATYMCKQLKIADESVCFMAIEEYQPSILSVAKNSALTSKEICSLALGCTKFENPILDWNVTFPDVPKPPVNPFIPPDMGSKTLRVLQLSDIHIDFEYVPGSLADCDQPLCCRNSSQVTGDRPSPSPDRLAGYWGDYRNCDIPLWTVENMFQHIAKNEQFDFIYWTGDLPPHNIWNQTRSDQLNALQILTKLFQKYFPNRIIYPTLGNHEAQPCNLFPTPNIKEDSIDWLYSTVSKEWTKTGLPAYLSSNITQGAFYSIKILPKLRIVSLNTNYCPRENFWLFINSTDPLGQLQWLIDILQESENNGDKVHIIGHIDPSKCLESWSKNYYRIVNRYESTITAQIFGHSHRDEIKIFYDLQNLTRAVSVAYLGPSVTTKSFLNPGYRVYTIDGNYDNSSFQVLDHETVYLNLTEANTFNVTKWRKEYSAKHSFKMEYLTPHYWNDLIDRMIISPKGPLVDKIVKFYSKSSDNFPECDLTCRRNLLCSFKQSRSDNFIPC